MKDKPHEASVRLKTWRRVRRVLTAIMLAPVLFVAWTAYRPVDFEVNGLSVFLGRAPESRGESWMGGFTGSLAGEGAQAVVWIGSFCYKVSYTKIEWVA